MNMEELPGFELWADKLGDKQATCGEDACFGMLTHGFDIEEEVPSPPPRCYRHSNCMNRSTSI